jgi:hypothetical protein
MYQFPAVRWQKNSSIRQAHSVAFASRSNGLCVGACKPACRPGRCVVLYVGCTFFLIFSLQNYRCRFFLVLVGNVGSYTQGRIAGPASAGSSRKAARAERCTPKTTAAALDG